MKESYSNKTTVADRIVTSICSVILMLITGIVTIVLFAKGGSVAALHIDLLEWYWRLLLIFSFISGVLGFFLGSEKMLEVFGFLWGTNKPKDGNWS